MKRRRPRGKLYTTAICQSKLLGGNADGSSTTKEGSASVLLAPDVRGKRAPAPFPVDLTQHEPTPPPYDPVPPLPDARIFVDPSAWKPRRLSVALEEAKARKQDECGNDEWTEEDDLLCFRREQWRMMKAMGIETQDTEPSECSSRISVSGMVLVYFIEGGRWRPGMP